MKPVCSGSMPRSGATIQACGHRGTVFGERKRGGGGGGGAPVQLECIVKIRHALLGQLIPAVDEPPARVCQIWVRPSP